MKCEAGYRAEASTKEGAEGTHPQYITYGGIPQYLTFVLFRMVKVHRNDGFRLDSASKCLAAECAHGPSGRATGNVPSMLLTR